MKKRILSLILVCVFLASFVSCSKSSPDSDLYDYNPKVNGKADQAVAEAEVYSTNAYDYNEAEPAYEKPREDSQNTNVKNDLSARKIIKNASLQFETKEYDAFMKSLYQSIATYGGYIENSDIYDGETYGGYRGSYSRSANITARIPASSYDDFLNVAGEHGSLTHKNEYVNDITLTYVDTESRIKALQTEYDALLEILAKAETVEAIIEVRSRISDLQYQLDSYQSQIRKYDDLVSYSTISIYVSEVRVETVNPEKLTFGERIKKGLSETFYDIGEGFKDFAVWFVVNLPYILIVAVVLIVLILVIKLIVVAGKKKRAKRRAQKYVNNLPNHEEKNTKE